MGKWVFGHAYGLSVTAHAFFTVTIMIGVEYHPYLLFVTMGVHVKNENKYQGELIRRLKAIFVDVVIMKLDPNYIQGIPDLLILHPNGWALLEVKRSINEPFRPNQEYYLNKLDQWSFAAMICPENEEEVLSDLQRKLGYY